jgi:hypothetical protein
MARGAYQDHQKRANKLVEQLAFLERENRGADQRGLVRCREKAAAGALGHRPANRSGSPTHSAPSTRQSPRGSSSHGEPPQRRRRSTANDQGASRIAANSGAAASIRAANPRGVVQRRGKAEAGTRTAKGVELQRAAASVGARRRTSTSATLAENVRCKHSSVPSVVTCPSFGHNGPLRMVARMRRR